MTDTKFYKANRKGFFKYLLTGMLFIPILLLFIETDNKENPAAVLLTFLPFLLTLWLYLDTGYSIEGSLLKYRSAFFRGKIEIKSIRKIIKGKTLWAGFKPALATNGLIIKYNKYNEIYIAPESNDDIVQALLNINPDIEVIDQ